MKSLFNKAIYYIFLTFIIVAIIVFKYRNQEDKSYRKRGEELIYKIENYKHDNNKLPNTILQLGLKESMNEGPYYEKKDSINYIVYFNIGFDNTKIYYSKTKKWKDEH